MKRGLRRKFIVFLLEEYEKNMFKSTQERLCTTSRTCNDAGGSLLMNHRTMNVLILAILLIMGVMYNISPIEPDNVTVSGNHRLSGNLDLQFSTYFGGQGYDYMADIAIDANGYIYITGTTESIDFPTTEGAFDRSHDGGTLEWLPIDAFVMKLSSDGQEIIYSTFLGGSGDDYGSDIEVDDLGNVYVAGSTDSSDFPTVNAYDDTHNSGEDCFVVKISPDGSNLVFSTYVGGSANDAPYGLAVAENGDCIVVGDTFSTDFPVVTSNSQPSCHTLGGTRDGFVFRLSNDGNSMNYSMYLGTSDKETAYGVAIDSQGGVGIVGYTTSADFLILNALDTTLNGSYDIFIARINETGHLMFSTYLGGSGGDRASTISVDDAGQIYIAGTTDGEGFPIVDVHDPILNGTDGLFLLVMEPLENEIIFSGILVNSSSSSLTLHRMVEESMIA